MTEINNLKENKKITSKNSLIELMRFLFALWVLYFHSYVPYKNNLFSEGYLAVEFFFILSGFYLMRSMQKYTHLSTKEGLPKFLKHRFKGIAIPFLINEVFVLIYSFVFGAFDISSNFLFGFLWYIRDLFATMIVIFLLRKLIKSDKVFYCILITLSMLFLFAFQQIPFLAWPRTPFRAFVSIPLGMLIALIPKIPFKWRGEQEKGKLYCCISTILFIIVSSLCFLIIMSQAKTELSRYLLVVLGYPSLLYFASCITFNNKILNWLGSLSFPIYAFQCIARVIKACGFENNTYLFIIIITLSITYSIIYYYVKRKKSLSK